MACFRCSLAFLVVLRIGGCSGSLLSRTFASFTHHLITNAVGPLLCSSALLKGGIPISTLAFLSSDSGSAEKFRAFEDGFAGYAASKAALNMGIRVRPPFLRFYHLHPSIANLYREFESDAMDRILDAY